MKHLQTHIGFIVLIERRAQRAIAALLGLLAASLPAPVLISLR